MNDRDPYSWIVKSGEGIVAPNPLLRNRICLKQKEDETGTPEWESP